MSDPRSKDAAGPSVEAAPGAPSRRAFVKRAGLAALGVTAVAPVVGAATAQAAGTQVAYTDAPNTFTADQTIQAQLGIGVTPAYPLHATRSDVGAVAEIDAYTMALLGRHTQDLGGQTYDLVNLYHRSCGDALFIAHQGGLPPGYSGPAPGGIGGLNVLVPHYLDDSGDGWHGSVLNDRTGMRGVKVQTQPNNDDVVAIEVLHWSNAYAAYFGIQPSPNGIYPQGIGGGILMDDYSTASSIKIGKWTAPNPGEAMIALSAQTTSPIPALRVNDNTGTVRALINSDGTTALGTPSPFAVQLQAEMPSSGIARNLALSNGNGTSGSGTQIEFDDSASQFALIAAVFDQTSSPRNGSLRFSVRANDTMTERLRLSGSGIGFFGARPAAKPVVSGSRAGNAALKNLLSGLSALGLVTDSTTA